MKTPQKVLVAATLVLATATGAYLYTGGSLKVSPDQAAGSGIDGVSKAKNTRLRMVPGLICRALKCSSYFRTTNFKSSSATKSSVSL